MSSQTNLRSKIDKIRAITGNALKVLKNQKEKINPIFLAESRSRTSSLGSEQDFELDEDEDEQLIQASSHDAIERWVSVKANSMEKREGATRTVKELQSYQLPKESKDLFTGFERMVSSPNKNDCLIHSLLTSLSATFRTLEKADKDSIASSFRREVLSSLLNKAKEDLPYRFTKRQMEEMLAETKSSGFLSDLHLRYLVNKYTFNVFFYELGAPRTDPWHLLMPYEGSETAPLILLYNPGQGHFEAVRDPKSEQYEFDLTLLKSFRDTSVFTDQGVVDRERGLQRCPFILWDVIKKKDTGELFVVVDQEEQDGICTHQYVSNYTVNRQVLKQIVNKPRVYKDQRIDILPRKDDYVLATPESRHYDTYKVRGGKQTRKNKSKKGTGGL
jgi:hypothetical protein